MSYSSKHSGNIALRHHCLIELETVEGLVSGSGVTMNICGFDMGRAQCFKEVNRQPAIVTIS